MATVLCACTSTCCQCYRDSCTLFTVLVLFVSMDANEINLDDLDNSDISSGWNSSEDEAPVMEVENDNSQDIQQLVDYEHANEEINRMESDDEPEAIPRSL